MPRNVVAGIPGEHQCSNSSGDCAERDPGTGRLSADRNVNTTDCFDSVVWFRLAA
jgi:hypothetical protein